MMPIYEYKCENCLHSFEELQKINDKPLKKCPKCKKPDLKKQMSQVNYQFKGEGFTRKEPKTVKEATANSEFGPANNFLERFEQVRKANGD